MLLNLSNCKVLIIDDTPTNIKILTEALKREYKILSAGSGKMALNVIQEDIPDIILLDIMMPEMDGYETCSLLKANPQTKDIPVMFITALSDIESKTQGFQLGAVDYITKPFHVLEVRARVRTHLELKQLRDDLEKRINERTEDLRKAIVDLDNAHNEIKSGYLEAIYRLTLAAEYKDTETGSHIKRLSLYTEVIAEAMGMEGEFTDLIYHSSPMHDLGKVAIPDSILLKQGGLTLSEWEVMKSHSLVGAKILEGSSSPYLQMAKEIALGHHERWDGTGYPEGRQGESIPLAARITNIADQYDALRSKRPYKLPLDHKDVEHIFCKGDGRTEPCHFDPAILDAFKRTSLSFAEIFHSCTDKTICIREEQQ